MIYIVLHSIFSTWTLIHFVHLTDQLPSQWLQCVNFDVCCPYFSLLIVNNDDSEPFAFFYATSLTSTYLHPVCQVAVSFFAQKPTSSEMIWQVGTGFLWTDYHDSGHLVCVLIFIVETFIIWYAGTGFLWTCIMYIRHFMTCFFGI